jgi:hypothetical protein
VNFISDITRHAKHHFFSDHDPQNENLLNLLIDFIVESRFCQHKTHSHNEAPQEGAERQTAMDSSVDNLKN